MKHPATAMTGADGKFAFTTNETNDGLPAGKYKLTFVWEEQVMSRSGQRPDQLKGAYADKGTSKFDLDVVDGKPVDLGVIELSTNGPTE